ncbi:BTAD domain-containing putative transcriptional regulator [Paenibacillus contaminans]|nr:BTAD domain-containing putative transcriptional regulator [Paenibacillus contaminans]
MKVVLIDDEPAMHLIMRMMLAKLPGVTVAGAFTDTASALAFLQDNRDIGLAFVDISLPGGGLAFAAAAAETMSWLQIVFVTSHKEFALEAYELSVIDYLVKPVSQERLQRTVTRAIAGRGALQPEAQPANPHNSAVSGKLVITALGDLSVSSSVGRVKWISRKCAELFAYLLLHQGKRVPRSRLVAEIFAGMRQDNAENYLNTTVYQLRKSLEPLGMRDMVRSENDGYALDLHNHIVDYAEFANQVEELGVIDSRNVSRALQVERLYTGELFGDKAYVWAMYETEHYAKLYTSLVVSLAEALIMLKDTTAASKLLYKLKERNPLDETAMRLLMSVYGETGDRKSLTALYNDYVRLVNRELGIQPGEELRRWYERLISQLSVKK